MAGNIGSKRNTQTYLFQISVDTVRFILLLMLLIHTTVSNNRQQVKSIRGIVFINEFLHELFPFDKQLLTGFISPVSKNPILQVFLS